MEFRQLHDGKDVPVLGIGTAGFGSSPSGYDEDLRAVQAALDLGYTHIDTAEVYGHGGSERVIGQAIKGRDRSSLFITSKVAKGNLAGEAVLEAMDGTLRRLETDYVDLYLIHAPNPSVPLEETFEALNQLVEHGKARYVGVSNFSREEVDRAYHLTSTILATNQVHYSLLTREPENNGVLEYCQQHDILLTAYSPLERGEIARNDVVREIAGKLGATPAQVALAWLIRKPHVITIPRSRSVEHLRENLGALEIRLDPEDVARLDDLGRGRLAVGR